MKVVVIKQYGGAEVLKIIDTEIPSVGTGDILVNVKASSVNPVDWKVRKGMLRFLPGQKFPKMLGGDLSGEVVEVGQDVSGFRAGDEVYGMISAVKGGAYAEYAIVTNNQIVHKPTTISFTEAAAISLAALTAYQSLVRLGKLEAGETVCVNGCSGGVGHFAVQIAKALGANVTGICSTKNIDFAKELGADTVLDYKAVDNILETSKKYDIFLDAVANQSYFNVLKALNRGGRYITTLPSISVILSTFFKIFSSKRGKIIAIRINSEDLRFLSELIKSNKLKVNIDKVYDMEDIQDAHRHSETGRVVGKLAVRID